ncbi:MAPEG family protein [Bradyrhizobium sp. USDA 4451]
MSVQMVLLPVLIQIGLTFALLFGMATLRTRTLASGEIKMADIALREPNWPARATQLGNCFANQFELPVLFYVLIAIALPLRRADLFIVLMSWVFVVTRFAHAGVFVTSNDVRPRSLAWFAGVLVLAAMWLYFALRLLLLI